MYKSKGSTLVIYLIIAGVIAAGGLAAYGVYRSMAKTISEQAEKIGSLETALEQEKEITRQLGEENDKLNRDIQLLENISKTLEAARIEHARRVADLEKKYREATNRIPAILADNKVCKQTLEEAVNSAKRNEALWEVFRLDYGSVIMNQPKPDNKKGEKK